MNEHALQTIGAFESATEKVLLKIGRPPERSDAAPLDADAAEYPPEGSLHVGIRRFPPPVVGVSPSKSIVCDVSEGTQNSIVMVIRAR